MHPCYVHVLKVFRSDILSENATWEGCELELDSERTSVPAFVFDIKPKKLSTSSKQPAAVKVSCFVFVGSSSCKKRFSLSNKLRPCSVQESRAEGHSAAKGKDASSMGAIRIP